MRPELWSELAAVWPCAYNTTYRETGEITVCQGCVDAGRLSQETHDKIQEFARKWPRSEFGPGHIVIGDDNVDDYCINYCIKLIQGVLVARMGVKLQALTQIHGIGMTHDQLELLENDLDYYQDHDTQELWATMEFLQELLEIPEEER